MSELELHQCRLLASSVRTRILHARSRWSAGQRDRALRDLSRAEDLCRSLVLALAVYAGPKPR